MILWIKNLIRRIKGKPPVSNIMVTKEDCYTTQEIFDKIARTHGEVLLVCIEHPRFDDGTAEVKCYAKLATHDSIITDISGGMIHELLDGEE